MATVQPLQEPEFDLRVLNLGAGVQSSALYLMAARGELGPKPDVAIFADTGWEPKRVYDYLDYLEEQAGHIIPIKRVSAGNIREGVLKGLEGKRYASLPFFTTSDGGKGMLRRMCTTEYKIQPITRTIREHLGVKRGGRVTVKVQQWFGISYDEVQRMRSPRDAWVTNHYPLIDMRMTRLGCLEWIQRNGYKLPVKSSCIGCPYHSDAFWRDMRDNHPEEWADAVEFDKLIRSGLRGVEQEAYLHSSLVPLDEVDLRTPEEKGQMTLFSMAEWETWAGECEGLCGV